MWIVLAFLTAIFTALQDIGIKKSLKEVDVYIVTWALWTFSLPVLLMFFLKEGVPSIGAPFFMAFCFSVPLLAVAVTFYIKELKSADLSVAVPMLAFTPLFLLGTSPLILKEFPRPLGILGVFFIVGGSYALFMQESHKGWLAPFKSFLNNKGSRYMLVVAFIFSISCNFDKIGVINSSSSFWILVTSATLSLIFFIVMICKTKNIVKQVRSNLKILILIGLFNALAISFQMIAIETALVPYLISIKRTSIVIASLYGFFILKEKGFKERFIGISIMLIGVFMISFS
jgi:uncharacterized membrane protein